MGTKRLLKTEADWDDFLVRLKASGVTNSWEPISVKPPSYPCLMVLWVVINPGFSGANWEFVTLDDFADAIPVLETTCRGLPDV